MFLLDTNLLSEVRRPAGSRVVKDWLASIDGLDPSISVVSIGEIALGAELLAGERRGEFRVWLDHIREVYSGRIIDVTDKVAETWGRRAAAARQAGQTVGVADGLIAATALVHGLTVATRNVRHMIAAGATAFNPWTGETHEPAS